MLMRHGPSVSSAQWQTMGPLSGTIPRATRSQVTSAGRGRIEGMTFRPSVVGRRAQHGTGADHVPMMYELLHGVASPRSPRSPRPPVGIVPGTAPTGIRMSFESGRTYGIRADTVSGGGAQALLQLVKEESRCDVSLSALSALSAARQSSRRPPSSGRRAWSSAPPWQCTIRVIPNRPMICSSGG